MRRFALLFIASVLVPASTLPAAELPDADFPHSLSTGRLLYHWHGGTLTRRVEGLIASAQRDRPALAAARAGVLQQQATLRQAESALWPVLNAAGRLQQQWVHKDTDGSDTQDTNYLAGLQITAPIFEGFALRNAVRSARATLAATRAQLELSEQQVIDDVWTAYYAFRTAAEQLDASRTLLASAQESYDVSLERYRLGAGDIVQLVDTFSTLAGARATLVNAETALYTSYALLLHAIGAAAPARRPVLLGG